MAALSGCSDSSQTSPPVIPASSSVTFILQADETGTYELSSDQAHRLLKLINSKPTSVIAPDEEWLTAESIAIFKVEEMKFAFHGALHFTNQEGYKFVWLHPFFEDHLWPPPKALKLPEAFSKMNDYDWTGR